MWTALLRRRWGNLCKHVCDLILKKSWPVEPWSSISHQRNILVMTIHRIFPLPVIMVFLKSQKWNPFCLFQILSVPSLAPCELPLLSELGDWHNSVRNWCLKNVISYISDLVFVIRWIFWPLSLLLPLNVVFFSLRGLRNFPSLCQVLAIPGLLPCGLPSYARRWAICTNLCGIDLWKTLSRTSLIQYWSPEEYSGLDCSLCLPMLPVNVFLNPKVGKPFLYFIKFWL